MGQQVLFTASTYSHILHFHPAPTCAVSGGEGWVVHVACGGALASIPEADEVIHLPLEKDDGAQQLGRRPDVAPEDPGGALCPHCPHTSLAAFYPYGGEGDAGAGPGDQHGARLSLR